jgi:hypothetical protein
MAGTYWARKDCDDMRFSREGLCHGISDRGDKERASSELESIKFVDRLAMKKKIIKVVSEVLCLSIQVVKRLPFIVL